MVRLSGFSLAPPGRRLEPNSLGRRVVFGVRARWLIDATGRGGAGLGGPPTRSDRLVANVVIFEAAPDDVDARSWVEAVKGGWWYTAPVPGHRRVLAYFTDSDLLCDSPIRTGESLLARLDETSHIRRSFDWSGDRTPSAGSPPIRRRGVPSPVTAGSGSATRRSRSTLFGVWQRFATNWAIRAPMSVSTGLCEKRLRLSVRAREGAETDTADSTSRPTEFAIRRQPRTRFAFRENPARERKAAEHAWKCRSLANSRDHGTSLFEALSSRFYVEDELTREINVKNP